LTYRQHRIACEPEAGSVTAQSHVNLKLVL